MKLRYNFPSTILKISLVAIFLIFLIFSTSCSHSPSQNNEYANIITNNSQKAKKYKFLYHVFSFESTLKNQEVSRKILQHKTEYNNWTAQKFEQEFEKFSKRSLIYTDLFLSFYTPKRNNNNIDDPEKTIWNITLNVNGKEYKGKAKKDKRIFEEITKIYPYHNRWSMPYIVSFPVPLSEVERVQAELTISGPMGTKTVLF